MTKPTLSDSEVLLLNERIASVDGRAEKTREAANFLFFHGGQYPSAALVRSYTQTGSLSDISEDLRAFWQSVRDSGRTQLQAPIPASLLDHFGKQLGDLWQLAATEARQVFDAERQSFADEKKVAVDALAQARDAAQALAEELALVRHAHKEQCETNQALSGQLQALSAQVQVWQSKSSSLENQLVQAQLGFSQDLAKLTEERDKEREGLKGQQKFAMLQIDASRASERDLREQLKFLRETQDNLVQSYRVKASNSEQALVEAKTEIRVLSERIKNLTGQGTPVKPKSKIGGVRKPLKKSSSLR